MPDFVTRLARKFAQMAVKGCPRNHDRAKACDECIEEVVAAAIREALEEAEKIGNDHIARLRTFRLARNTYVPAIVREIERVVAALAALREGGQS